jgi:hypothetical protein
MRETKILEQAVFEMAELLRSDDHGRRFFEISAIRQYRASAWQRGHATGT